jgi:hypothetical protein
MLAPWLAFILIAKAIRVDANPEPAPYRDQELA